MTATTVPFKLTGQSLVDYVNSYDLTTRTRTELIKDAGYVYDNGQAMYTEFYTELLRAKGITPVLDSDVEGNAYDDLDKDTKALYDAVDERFGEKWSHEEVLSFIDELADLDIQTVDVFEDNFYGVYGDTREFAQQYYEDLGVMDDNNPLYSFIDWHEVARELEYDFDVLEFEYDFYIFRK